MYQGLIAPLVTPLDRTGDVCAVSVARQIETLRGRVDGLMPALSTGEGWLLSDRQWTDMIRYTCQHAGDLPVFAGVEVPTTEAVVARYRGVADAGLAAIVVTTPFGAEVGQDEMVGHYRTVLAETGTEVFVYNEYPISQNHTMLPTLVQICQLPGIVGVKESSGDAELVGQLRSAVTGVPVFAGWENLMLAGGPVAGFIGPLILLEPELVRSMLDCPSPELQTAVDEAAQRYGLFDDEWYRRVKQELRRRHVINYDTVVQEVNQSDGQHLVGHP